MLDRVLAKRATRGRSRHLPSSEVDEPVLELALRARVDKWRESVVSSSPRSRRRRHRRNSCRALCGVSAFARLAAITSIAVEGQRYGMLRIEPSLRVRVHNARPSATQERPCQPAKPRRAAVARAATSTGRSRRSRRSPGRRVAAELAPRAQRDVHGSAVRRAWHVLQRPRGMNTTIETDRHCGAARAAAVVGILTPAGALTPCVRAAPIRRVIHRRHQGRVVAATRASINKPDASIEAAAIDERCAWPRTGPLDARLERGCAPARHGSDRPHGHGAVAVARAGARRRASRRRCAPRARGRRGAPRTISRLHVLQPRAARLSSGPRATGLRSGAPSRLAPCSPVRRWNLRGHRRARSDARRRQRRGSCRSRVSRSRARASRGESGSDSSGGSSRRRSFGGVAWGTSWRGDQSGVGRR
jgi:hypothetical protein